MDPTATLQRLFDAINERDWDEADQALLDLQVWSQRGGATPVIPHWFKAIDCDYP